MFKCTNSSSLPSSNQKLIQRIVQGAAKLPARTENGRDQRRTAGQQSDNQWTTSPIVILFLNTAVKQMRSWFSHKKRQWGLLTPLPPTRPMIDNLISAFTNSLKARAPPTFPKDSLQLCLLQGDEIVLLYRFSMKPQDDDNDM